MFEKDYNFKVKVLEAGQRGRYQDSYYTYEVTSDCSEAMVKDFCTKLIKKSYMKADMPDAFSCEFLEFKRITENNKLNADKDVILTETYRYKCKSLYTD